MKVCVLFVGFAAFLEKWLNTFSGSFSCSF